MLAFDFAESFTGGFLLIELHNCKFDDNGCCFAVGGSISKKQLKLRLKFVKRTPLVNHLACAMEKESCARPPTGNKY
jgi:hypothetical protein